jgi:hypothetical protein
VRGASILKSPKNPYKWDYLNFEKRNLILPQFVKR